MNMTNVQKIYELIVDKYVLRCHAYFHLSESLHSFGQQGSALLVFSTIGSFGYIDGTWNSTRMFKYCSHLLSPNPVPAPSFPKKSIRHIFLKSVCSYFNNFYYCTRY